MTYASNHSLRRPAKFLIDAQSSVVKSLSSAKAITKPVRNCTKSASDITFVILCLPHSKYEHSSNIISKGTHKISLNILMGTYRDNIASHLSLLSTFSSHLTVIIGENLLSSFFSFTFKAKILQYFISSQLTIWFCHYS